MSLAEVKKSIRTLPSKQRRALASYIAKLNDEEDPAWMGEMQRRKATMKSGRKISREDAMRLLGIKESDLAAAR